MGLDNPAADPDPTQLPSDHPEPWHNLWDKVDIFILAHLMGYWCKVGPGPLVQWSGLPLDSVYRVKLCIQSKTLYTE
jgi:hypothetical protein